MAVPRDARNRGPRRAPSLVSPSQHAPVPVSRYVWGPTPASFALSTKPFITTVASWSTTTAQTTGFGYSFFVGRPNTNHKVKMKDYFLNTSGPISMISDSAGICTINNLQRIKRTRHPVVYTEGGVWKAEMGGTGTIGSMGIRCFYFNQDQ
jgi:hypothetical protein